MGLLVVLISGNYSGTFTGSYLGTFTGSYLGTFTGSYLGNGTISGTFSGNFNGIATGTFTGSHSGSFTGSIYPLNYAGDLLVNSASAPVRLGSGSNGSVLQVDNTATSGLSWLDSSYAAFYPTNNISSTNATFTNVAWGSTLVADPTNNITITSNGAGTAKTRITFAGAGVYLITGIIMWANNATGIRFLEFQKNTNGTSNETIAEFKSIVNATNGDNTGMMFALMVKVSAGDYYEAWAYQTSGGLLNIFGTRWRQFVPYTN